MTGFPEKNFQDVQSAWREIYRIIIPKIESEDPFFQNWVFSLAKIHNRRFLKIFIMKNLSI